MRKWLKHYKKYLLSFFELEINQNYHQNSPLSHRQIWTDIEQSLHQHLSSYRENYQPASSLQAFQLGDPGEVESEWLAPSTNPLIRVVSCSFSGFCFYQYGRLYSQKNSHSKQHFPLDKNQIVYMKRWLTWWWVKEILGIWNFNKSLIWL